MATVALRNLEKRRHVWVARMRIPEDVVHIFGKVIFSRSTKQTDPHRAAVVAGPILEGWRQDIARARQQGVVQARESIERMDLPAAFKVAMMQERGIRPALFLDYLEPWKAALDKQGTKPRQVEQFARDVKLYGTPDTLRLDEVTATRTQKWSEDRLAIDGDSLKTVRRRLSAIRGYWGYLQETGKIGRDAICPIVFKAPLSVRRAAKSAKREEPQRDAFTAAEVVKLWTAAGDKTPLADIIALAAFTGGRVEELSAIKLEAITMKEGRPGEVALRSKTEAGNRTVPLVNDPVLQDIFTRRMASSKDGFLLPAATKSKFAEKSNILGKQFGRLKKRLGFPDSLVFHSIRKTVATLLHNSDCPEATAANILGHKITSMSYGVYSAGTTLAARLEWLTKATAAYGFPGAAIAKDQEPPAP